MSPTINRVLDIIKQHPAQWYLKEEQYVRCFINDCEFCPLTYANWITTGKQLHVGEYPTAAFYLGVTRQEADNFTGVADHRGPYINETNTLLRSSILSACGLTLLR